MDLKMRLSRPMTPPVKGSATSQATSGLAVMLVMVAITAEITSATALAAVTVPSRDEILLLIILNIHVYLIGS